MNLSMISFTGNGIKLSQTIYKKLSDKADLNICLFSKCEAAFDAEGVMPLEESICQWAGRQMELKNAILFIGACGIAVRAIAPFVTDKLHDSPVLVMDETGRFIIPILSGHVGGANRLAMLISSETGAEPVITTATDINNRFAIDVFARDNNLRILNKDGIKKVSARVLAGEKITVSIEDGNLMDNDALPEEVSIISYPPQEKADVAITSDTESTCADLVLVPQKYYVGIGCRKGKEAGLIKDFFISTLSSAGIPPEQVKSVASIDLKASEEGIISLCREIDVPFITFSAEELNAVEGEFSHSEYVKKITGVDNICERAAMKAAGKKSRLVMTKQMGNGMTMAVAERIEKQDFRS